MGKMLNIDMRKIYNFYPIEPAPDAANLPTGGDIYYECADCQVVVNSVPFIKAACACGNLTGGGGKLTVKNPERVRVVRGKLK
jgi:hypothetical protein